MLGTPAHLLLPVNVQKSSSQDKDRTRASRTGPGIAITCTQQRSHLQTGESGVGVGATGAAPSRPSPIETQDHGHVERRASNTRSTASNKSINSPRQKSNRRLYRSAMSHILSLSSPPLAAKPDQQPRSTHSIHGMCLHLDPATGGCVHDLHSASSTRPPSVAATSSRSSLDSSSRRSNHGHHHHHHHHHLIQAPSRRISTSVPAGAESVPLTVQDALVGLIAASCQAQCDIDELDTQPTGKTAPLRRIGYEIKSFKMTAQLMHKFLRRLENGQLQHADRAKLLELDVLIGVLTASILTISELEVRLENMVMQADETGLSVEEMCQGLSRSLAKDANRISMVEFTMTKLLSMLQVSNPDEALRHHSQAHLAIMYMLQADIALAQRMQQLQDTSLGLQLVPRHRRDKIAALPPPGYSVPSPQDDDHLPNYYEALDDDSVAIQPRNWSVYSGLNLADISVLSRINLPVILGEINDGYFYTVDYAASVAGALNALSDGYSPHKSKALAQILGITEPTKETRKVWSDQPGLAHRIARKITKGRLGRHS